MKLTDKEILDFVKENITIAKGMTGHIEIKGVHCSIRGDVGGDVVGVSGNVGVGGVMEMLVAMLLEMSMLWRCWWRCCWGDVMEMLGRC